MGKSRGDMRRRNPVTREMIERHRNAVHADKRRRVQERITVESLDNLDPDWYDARVDEAGNVNVIYTGDTHG